ncbi:PP2C family serine/threonine-protein phosphatase [Herbaspirillum huttiense]|uniref:PP2C family serine/threonine-protein phosphatase n=2 Tax=Herbaspirillum huttiense TaxID=863372 RepID=A0AAJ2H7T9_9BURK|nr:protein phosphatase 2C domain-containing protein [Herbaspirillum huttiense]MDR9838389.1 PP2C family serine/threonine-protein phosphatase [Herbaspirillum huttiense]
MGQSVIKVSGAKVTGRSHEQSGAPCQDYFFCEVRGRSASIALADGAGSREFSQLGAEVVTKQVATFSIRAFDHLYDLISRDAACAQSIIIRRLVAALNSKIKRKKLEISQLASTLLFVTYHDGRYIAGHLGDGVIAIKDLQGMQTLSAPHNGEYANVTYFVTDKNSELKIRLFAGTVNSTFSAVLMSDGAAESLYEKRAGRPGKAVEQLFAWAQKLPAKKMNQVLMANLTQTLRMKTTDDCSIAILSVL